MNSWNTPHGAAGITSYATRKRLALAAALLLLAPFTAGAVPADAMADAAKVEWQWGVKIPLRDGVRHFLGKAFSTQICRHSLFQVHGGKAQR